jgi:chromosomal replication initiation ATPase DnaA
MQLDDLMRTWHAIRDEAEREIGPSKARSWLYKLAILSIGPARADGVIPIVTLQAPTKFHRDYVEHEFGAALNRAAGKALRAAARVEITIIGQKASGGGAA